MRILAILLLLAAPAVACTDSTTDIREDVQLAVLCKPFTVQPGEAHCKLKISNENQCLSFLLPARLGITTTYYQSDPGGLVTGESLNKNDLKLLPYHTRSYSFHAPIDDLSSSMEVRIHLVGQQDVTGTPLEVFRVERYDAP